MAAVTPSLPPEPARPAPSRPRPRGDAPTAESFADQLPERARARASDDRAASEKSARAGAGADTPSPQRPASIDALRRPAPANQTGAETTDAAADMPGPKVENADQPAQAPTPDAMIAHLLAASRRAGDACARNEEDAADATPDEEAESANGESGAVIVPIVAVEAEKAAADPSPVAATTTVRTAALGASASHGRGVHPDAPAPPQSNDAAAPTGDPATQDMKPATPGAQPEREAAFAPAAATGVETPAHSLAGSVDPAPDLARGLSFSPAATPPPAPPAAAPANPSATPPMPVQMVPLAIGLKAIDGAREFSIRLDPDELGRVDVNLSIGDDGRVEASLVVDRVETLALLQRDARTLERAFDQAGLTADSNSIRFSLRQESQSGHSSGQQGGDRDESGAAFQSARDVEADLKIDPPAMRLWRGSVGPAGVDIRV